MLVDPRDLIDATQVAEIIGITNPGGVSVYRRRYGDFPAPIVEKGRCVLWRRQDVGAWARARGRDTAVTRDPLEPGRRRVNDSE
jgi:predicted DNA-binding transcriptional regulator AlpA